MTDDRTAPEQGDGSTPDPAGDPAPAAQPPAPQPPAAPQAWPSPAAPQTWPAPTAPQAWPPPAAPAGSAQQTTPAWGSPAGAPVPGDPGAPDWARPGGGQAPAWGTPPGYPYGGAPGAFGQPTASGTRSSFTTGRIVGLVAAGVAILLAVVVGLAALVVSAGRGDRTASGSGTGAPSFGVPDPGATGADPQQPLPTTPPTPAPKVPSPTSSAGKAYVAKANQFCRATTDPDLKAIDPLQKTDPPGYLRKAAKINRDLDARLRQDVPDDLKSTVAIITKDWDTLSENYEKAADAFEAGDAAAMSRYLAAGAAANTEGNDVAKQIGMADCADAGGIGGTPGGGPAATPGVTA